MATFTYNIDLLKNLLLSDIETGFLVNKAEKTGGAISERELNKVCQAVVKDVVKPDPSVKMPSYNNLILVATVISQFFAKATTVDLLINKRDKYRTSGKLYNCCENYVKRIKKLYKSNAPPATVVEASASTTGTSEMVAPEDVETDLIFLETATDRSLIERALIRSISTRMQKIRGDNVEEQQSMKFACFFRIPELIRFDYGLQFPEQIENSLLVNWNQTKKSIASLYEQKQLTDLCIGIFIYFC